VTTRCIYMGTPAFACPALRALADMENVQLDLVVTQPDRQAGRGRKLQPPAVKVAAEELGLPVYQTASLRAAEARAPLVAAQPDLIVVAAFGLILGRSVLDLPALGCVNLHASLLPAYRGAAPIAAAIATGETRTGVTLMQMERGLDTGPILDTLSIDISADDTTDSLTTRLGITAADLLVQSLPDLVDGQLPPVPQGEGATLTRPLTKVDGWIDWSKSAVELERHVRAMWSWPRAWTSLPSGEVLQIHATSVFTSQETIAEVPGTILEHSDGLIVAAGQGALKIEQGQLPGGRPQPGSTLALRQNLAPHTILGAGGAPSALPPLVSPVRK
jgi:methionyl-tRNA formyltransferase